MNGSDIQPGDLYALASAEPGRVLRPVTAVRVEGSYLIYAGPSGAEWAADISRVAGRWDAHANAATAAEAVATALRQSLECEAASTAEVGYCQFRVRIVLTTAQALRAAEHMRGVA